MSDPLTVTTRYQRGPQIIVGLAGHAHGHQSRRYQHRARLTVVFKR